GVRVVWAWVWGGGRWAGRTAAGWPASTQLFVLLTLGAAMVGISVSCQTTSPVEPPEQSAGLEPMIRVRLASTEQTVSVTTDGTPVRWGTGPLGQGDVVVAVGRATFARTGGAVEAVAGAATGRSLSGFLSSGEREQRFTVRVGDDDEAEATTFDGRLSISLGARGRLDVIAMLPMERYLEGVLQGELVRGWPLASFQAQAVAARGYALHERTRARASGRAFDVESTTLDQVFAGASGDPRISEAVETTRGVVLLDATAPGEPVLRSYYSSTCGGRAASSAGVWPSGAGLRFNAAVPLQGSLDVCPCEDSPLYRWDRTRTTAEARARLRAWGERAGHPVKRCGRIASIDAADLNAVDRPNTFTVEDGSGGEFSLTAEELRVAMNTSVRGQPRVTRESRLPSGDVRVGVRGSAITLRGRGFGHGVGMCQYGARGRALRGEDWRGIVVSYYPGARLARMW
ncbi:MAG: SpoIID/LytB domain-containing protein, partial [Planctomycetota bacterium]